MAESPPHRFGQMVGDLLEDLVEQLLRKFCDTRHYYLDKKGPRGNARSGKKVAWEDRYGNVHDLDFVIEKDGTKNHRGRPLAFIEVAWRRYRKHSRNKAQEIQGAILPIAETYGWDKPFLGVVLAGIFTQASVTQLKSLGFGVLHFPYPMIVAAFAEVGVDITFDEQSKDEEFKICVQKIKALGPASIRKLKRLLLESNSAEVEAFLGQLRTTVDRMIDSVIIVPLYGDEVRFTSLPEAITFISSHDASESCGPFRRFEVVVRYSNGDSVNASLATKEKVLDFLHYVQK